MKDSNNPKCDMHEALVSYLYDEASPEETTRVRAHLDECSACAAELASFRQVRGLLQSWELEDVPVLRISTEPARNSTLRRLSELFTALPVWTRSIGVLATAMLLLALMGTDVKINKDGFSLRMSVFQSHVEPPASEISRSQVEAIVTQLISDKLNAEQDQIELKLAQLEASQGLNSSDLAKLAARLKEQHAKLAGLERDIDRREGLSLTDLLLSGDSDRGGSSGAGDGQ